MKKLNINAKIKNIYKIKKFNFIMQQKCYTDNIFRFYFLSIYKMLKKLFNFFLTHEF